MPNNNLTDSIETVPVFSHRVGSWRISVNRHAFSAPHVAGLYDRLARRWTRKVRRFGLPCAYEALFRSLLGAGLLHEPPRRVLDCGTGTGALSSALSRAVPQAFRLDAIDVSARMLDHAAETLREIDPTVSLRQADVRKLPYDDDSFDIVMTAHMLEHVADPVVALSEMMRVLKPGGVMIACLTRRSALGFFVHCLWRTHIVTPAQAQLWFLETGLEHVALPEFGRGTLSRRLSLAIVGCKPRIAGNRVARKPGIDIKEEKG